MPRKQTKKLKQTIENAPPVSPAIGQVPDHEPPTPYLQQAPPSFKVTDHKGILIFILLLIICFGFFLRLIFK